MSYLKHHWESQVLVQFHGEGSLIARYYQGESIVGVSLVYRNDYGTLVNYQDAVRSGSVLHLAKVFVSPCFTTRYIFHDVSINPEIW